MKGLLSKAGGRAASIIERRRKDLDALVERLLEEETLERSDLDELLGERPAARSA